MELIYRNDGASTPPSSQTVRVVIFQVSRLHKIHRNLAEATSGLLTRSCTHWKDDGIGQTCCLYKELSHFPEKSQAPANSTKPHLASEKIHFAPLN